MRPASWCQALSVIRYSTVCSVTTAQSLNPVMVSATLMNEDCVCDSSFSAARLLWFSIQWMQFAVGLWQGPDTTTMLFVDPNTVVYIHNLERAWQTFKVGVWRLGILALQDPQTPHSWMAAKWLQKYECEVRLTLQLVFCLTLPLLIFLQPNGINLNEYVHVEWLKLYFTVFNTSNRLTYEK